MEMPTPEEQSPKHQTDQISDQSHGSYEIAGLLRRTQKKIEREQGQSERGREYGVQQQPNN